MPGTDSISPPILNTTSNGGAYYVCLTVCSWPERFDYLTGQPDLSSAGTVMRGSFTMQAAMDASHGFWRKLLARCRSSLGRALKRKSPGAPGSTSHALTGWPRS